MEKKPTYWPDEVPDEQKLYYLIRRMNRIKSSGHVYETSQTFTGVVKRSQEIYFQDLYELDLQARGIIPPLHREAYDLPLDYDEKVKDAELPKLPNGWQELYLCGSRCIAIPKGRDAVLLSLQPSYGDDPLESYLAASSKSFGHWLIAAKQAKAEGKNIPQKPKGRIPEDLSEEISKFIETSEVPTVSKFETWKKDWVNGKTTQPWKGRMPFGASLPEGYKRMSERES